MMIMIINLIIIINQGDLERQGRQEGEEDPVASLDVEVFLLRNIYLEEIVHKKRYVHHDILKLSLSPKWAVDWIEWGKDWNHHCFDQMLATDPNNWRTQRKTLHQRIARWTCFTKFHNFFGVFSYCTFCPQARQADGDAEDGADAGGDDDAGDGENLDLDDGDGGDIGGDGGDGHDQDCPI